MSDEATGTGSVDVGTSEGTPQATTQETPKAAVSGQPAGRTERTTEGQPATTDPSGPATAGESEDTFFDPRDLPPELIPAYKQMQKAWSKKTEGLKSQRQKIEAYDNFQKDPVTAVQQLAGQMGYKLSRADAAGVVASQQNSHANWEPETWDEVLTKAEARAEEKVMKKLEPLIGQIQEDRKKNVEKMLDDTCPDWRQYEDDMIGVLRKHPSLANDPTTLYRMSVPPEVLETQATQRALRRLQQKSDAAKVSGSSTTKSQPASYPDKPLSFNDAVKFARAKLTEQGLRGPA